MLARTKGKQHFPLMLCHAQLLVWVHIKVARSKHIELQFLSFWIRRAVEHHCVKMLFSSPCHGNLPAVRVGSMFDLNSLNGCTLILCLISLMSFVMGADLVLILSLLLFCAASPHPAVPLAGRKQAVSTASASLLPGQRHVCSS